MDGKACKTELTAGSYSSAYPKAVYYPGQQVILVHPMKVFLFGLENDTFLNSLRFTNFLAFYFILKNYKIRFSVN